MCLVKIAGEKTSRTLPGRRDTSANRGRPAHRNRGAGRKRGLLLAFVVLAVGACSRGNGGEEAAVPATEAATAAAQGSAKLSWIPPTSNSDGSKLTALAGYKIYYGTSPQYLQRTIDTKDPSVTDYTIENLPPYTYYFVITAYTADGTESSRSNIVSKTVK
jgi:Fibronectin type III domain